MADLRSMMQSQPETALALSGLAIGFAFGALALRTNFCVMGAVSDWRTSGAMGRIGAVALAATVAILGTQALDAAGIVDLTRSMYLTPRLNWAGAIFGGLLFGFGMVWAGGCASRNLLRAGAGDLKSLVTLLVLALVAFATMGGVLGPLRAMLEMATAVQLETWKTQSLVEAVAHTGPGADTARSIAALAIAGPLAAFAVLRCGVLRDPANLIGGLGAGALVVLGWAVTGLAFDDMAVKTTSPASLSFVRPVADAADWLQRATALGWPGFGAAVVFGTLLGSFCAAFTSGRFRLQGFAGTADLSSHLWGALAMGIGGVFALGCSIGQGITGLSTLALQSFLATASILAGAWLALDRLERSL